MTLRGPSGWQTAFADLSLILFLVIAAAYRETDDEPVETAAEAVDIALGQPMGVFRPIGDADLRQWLEGQHLQDGEVATVLVRHAPGAATAAVAEAALLVSQIEQAGETARLMVEPSDYPETLVVIAHDDRMGLEEESGTEIADTR